MKLIEEIAVFMRAILAPPVRMMNQPRQRPLARHSPEQRLTDQILGDPGSHGISHDLSAVHILVPCQIEPAFLCRDVGDITELDLIRRCRLKLLLKQILRYRQGMP
jgi:hypothetical protein